jgi:hypothetical protein
MSIVCIALIGKQNEPLYFYCKEDGSEYFNMQMISHSSIDVLEERKKRSKLFLFSSSFIILCRAQLSSATFDLYFGQLFAIESYRIYGSYTNTHLKIVVICDSVGADNVGIREAVVALGAAFVNISQNPFQEINSSISSKKFDSIISQIISRQNSLISKRRF